MNSSDRKDLSLGILILIVVIIGGWWHFADKSSKQEEQINTLTDCVDQYQNKLTDIQYSIDTGEYDTMKSVDTSNPNCP